MLQKLPSSERAEFFFAYSAPLAACELCIWLCTHNYCQPSERCCSQISGGNYIELNIWEPQLETAEEYLRIVMLQNSWQKKGEVCSCEPGQVILLQVINVRCQAWRMSLEFKNSFWSTEDTSSVRSRLCWRCLNYLWKWIPFTHKHQVSTWCVWQAVNALQPQLCIHRCSGSACW